MMAKHGEGETLDKLDYMDHEMALSARYEIINNTYIFIEYLNRQVEGDVLYIPAIYFGKTNSLVTGLNIGF